MAIDEKVIILIALAAFLLIQIFAAIMVVVLRYHFRVFSLPGDRRAFQLANLMAIGSASFFIVAAAYLYLGFL